MKFSITTPSLNQVQYIGTTIESVLTQEGDIDIEYFIMDGGSTDGSADLIASYADRVNSREFPIRCLSAKVEWVSQEDDGQSAAINMGLKRSSGDVHAYINSDDRYLPGAFAAVAQCFQSDADLDFVYGDGNVIDDAGTIAWEWLSRPYNFDLLSTYHFLWNDFTNYIMQQATFWRSSATKEIGLFDETLHYSMDLEFWLRAGAAGLTLHHVPTKLAEFRLIEGTKSRSHPLIFWPDNLEIFRRYNPTVLPKFFSYYYYNLAAQADFTLDLGASALAVLQRWTYLDDQEYTKVRIAAEQGLALAYGLCAIELLRRGRTAEADDSFQKYRASRSAGRPTTLAASYTIRSALGRRGSSLLDAAENCLIRTYRRTCVDYRYRK